MMFARDLVGSAEQIAEQLYAHAGFQQVKEVVFAVPGKPVTRTVAPR